MTDQENLLFLIHSQLLHVAYAFWGFFIGFKDDQSEIGIFITDKKTYFYISVLLPVYATKKWFSKRSWPQLTPRGQIELLDVLEICF